MDAIKQVSPIDLSKYVIKYVNNMGHEVNHLKLQKLIYYTDAWHSVFIGKPLIIEDFQAWMHGPVVRTLWDYYKGESILNGVISYRDDPTDLMLDVTFEQMEIINDVLDEYGDKSSYYLECLTHDEYPWQHARRGYAPSDKCTNIIPKEIIKQFYEEKLYGEREQG